MALPEVLLITRAESRVNRRYITTNVTVHNLCHLSQMINKDSEQQNGTAVKPADTPRSYVVSRGQFWISVA